MNQNQNDLFDTKHLFDHYHISSSGYVINSKRNTILSGSFDSNSKNVYVKIRKKMYPMHKLVAQSFITGYDENTHKIIFKNNNPIDCSLDNIQIQDKDIYQIGQRKTILKDFIIDSNGYILNVRLKMIPGWIDKTFKVVSLRGKRYMLHKLMVQAFIPGYDENTDLIQFKDHDKNNCSLENLYIKKNGRLYNPEITEEIQKKFESYNPYRIVNYFLTQPEYRNNDWMFSSSFTREDLKQVLIMYLWKKYPNYHFNKSSEMTFINYSMNNLKILYKSMAFKIYLKGLSDITTVQFDSFDHDIIAISPIEYVSNNFKKSHRVDNLIKLVSTR